MTGCLLPLATKRDYLKRRLLLVTPWRPLSQVYFDTDEFKPPTSQLSSRDKKGGEKVAKKARRVLDMTELRQRPIAARLHDRPCDPSTPISASCAAMSDPWQPKISVLKGILHQKIFYRLNLIFWIVMGCGIARFGRRGLKTTET